MNNEELINVPVPRSRLLEVYGLLGRPAPGSSGGNTGLTNEAESDSEERWHDALLARAYRESSPKMKGMLDYLADRPGVRVTSAEVAKAISYTRPQLAGVLGAFGRRWKNRYRQNGPWFFSAEWSPTDEMWVYWMTQDVARVIKPLRK